MPRTVYATNPAPLSGLHFHQPKASMQKKTSTPKKGGGKKGGARRNPAPLPNSRSSVTDVAKFAAATAAGDIGAGIVTGLADRFLPASMKSGMVGKAVSVALPGAAGYALIKRGGLAQAVGIGFVVYAAKKALVAAGADKILAKTGATMAGAYDSTYPTTYPTNIGYGGYNMPPERAMLPGPEAEYVQATGAPQHVFVG